ncbi:hypothetical protein WOLCODRAFT_166578 [Wolfiporia cocos MD-104 SS10]|uniref:Uncharacterized protein n=1 Tax=Wolfiporia cocos (strain MD-104) TaxID=742152 RepID=A0A2H3JE68_WOLCO|nr:hypothetical protein WOLCODRAFT_166578 [Wolfiporia cocos MD-104 SS10]
MRQISHLASSSRELDIVPPAFVAPAALATTPTPRPMSLILRRLLATDARHAAVPSVRRRARAPANRARRSLQRRRGRRPAPAGLRHASRPTPLPGDSRRHAPLERVSAACALHRWHARAPRRARPRQGPSVVNADQASPDPRSTDFVLLRRGGARTSFEASPPCVCVLEPASQSRRLLCWSRA